MPVELNKPPSEAVTEDPLLRLLSASTRLLAS